MKSFFVFLLFFSVSVSASAVIPWIQEPQAGSIYITGGHYLRFNVTSQDNTINGTMGFDLASGGGSIKVDGLFSKPFALLHINETTNFCTSSNLKFTHDEFGRPYNGSILMFFISTCSFDTQLANIQASGISPAMLMRY